MRDDKYRSHYDLAVIGAGSAGFSAAVTAAHAGAQVALVGYGTIGGTCVNVGCVPSKNLIRAADGLHAANHVGRFAGLSGGAQLDDWLALRQQMADLVQTLRKSKYIDLLPEYPRIAYFDGLARMTTKGVTVNGKPLAAERIIIAAGSSPRLPDIGGIESIPCLTSATIFELERLPRSVLVIGGGFIGCEIAQMLSRFGVSVTLATRSRLLPASDPEIGDALTEYLGAEGIDIQTGLTYHSLIATGDEYVLSASVGGNERSLAAERVLAATGRRPNTSWGLKESGITLKPDGAVQTDEHMRTSVRTVYAAGDVTGQDEFVYMAAYGARIAALNALHGDRLSYDNRAMPWVVFTDPQVAGVGLTESQAMDRGFEVKTSLVPLSQVPRALAARDTRGLIKLTADAATDRLLGAQLVAPEGADSIQTAVLAIKQGLTIKELGETIFPYLTTVEGLKLAAQSFDKDITKLSCCAG